MSDRIFSKRVSWVIVEVTSGGALLHPMGREKPKRVRGGFKADGQSFIGSNVYLICNSRRSMRGVWAEWAAKHKRGGE